MQLVQSGLGKTSVALSTAVRNTSCSRGWLRIVVQCIFGTFTVASFILIVIITMQRPAKEIQTHRCTVERCRIMCYEAPFYGYFEEDIINSVKNAEENCDKISLTLHNPKFVNYTLPSNWLSEMETSIDDLQIIGGNLRNIAPEAFMSHFASTIYSLSFQSITVLDWTPSTLMGLSRLRSLYLRNCLLFNIEKYALQVVEESLKTLTIISSYKWNPENMTGIIKFHALTSVCLTGNNFNNKLGRYSFSGLEHCKILYLNSCKITAIGLGAFDDLNNLEVLYLNNNLLTTIPTGLLNNLITTTGFKPRISLHDNPWHCDCSHNDMSMLHSKAMIMVDPVCKYPEEARDLEYSNFLRRCNSESDVEIIASSMNNTHKLQRQANKYTFLNGVCYNGNISRNNSFRLISPVRQFKCVNINRVETYHRSLFYARTNRSSINDDPNPWIHRKLYMRSDQYSTFEIGSVAAAGYGLLWYQDICPNEVYCVSIVPNFLRLYNVISNARYTFCPIHLASGIVESEKCVDYDKGSMESYDTSPVKLVFLLVTGIACLIFGAICVYAVIRMNPSLLKGSKRLLFVKHKTVDALVLPPKIPLRNDLLNDEIKENFIDKKIFITPASQNSLMPNFVRSKSIRSSKSNAPSYISALQPTEDQLAEWRIRHHFDNNSTLTSISDVSTISLFYNSDSVYYSIDVTGDVTYESLKDNLKPY